MELNLIEGYGFNSIALQYLLISSGKNVDRAHIIKYNPNVNSFFYFLFQYIQYPIPPLSLVYDEILYKDKLLCLLYVLQEIWEEICTTVKVFDFSVLPYTETCNVLYILALFSKYWRNLTKLFVCIFKAECSLIRLSFLKVSNLLL